MIFGYRAENQGNVAATSADAATVRKTHVAQYRARSNDSAIQVDISAIALNAASVCGACEMVVALRNRQGMERKRSYSFMMEYARRAAAGDCHRAIAGIRAQQRQIVLKLRDLRPRARSFRRRTCAAFPEAIALASAPEAV